MKKQILVSYESITQEELSPEDKILVEKAKDICQYGYAPFSNFHVGCAVQLENGVIITGNNQENASFPCGTCAERTTIFYAHAQYPDSAPVAIAIAARSGSGNFTSNPLPPCGACRQALLEMEHIFNKPLRIILYGEKNTLIVPDIKSLLPFHFDEEMMQ